MQINSKLLEQHYNELEEDSRRVLDEAIATIVDAKKQGGKIMVVTGSGPNIHEGVTTLIAQLMEKGIVDLGPECESEGFAPRNAVCRK